MTGAVFVECNYCDGSGNMYEKTEYGGATVKCPHCKGTGGELV